MSFSAGSYYRDKFSKISFSNEILKEIEFEECEFDGCSFIKCKFEKCKFIECRFKGSTLSAISPLGSRFNVVKFSQCKASGIDWTLAKEVDELSFTECQINYSNFKFMKLPKIKMVKCEAKENDFAEADFNHADFQSTDFENSVFFKTNLTGADLRKAINYNIDIRTNILKKTRFSLPEAMSLLNHIDIIIE